MDLVSAAVVVISGLNAAVIFLRPIPRLHSRLDILEARLVDLQRAVDRLVDKS